MINLKNLAVGFLVSFIGSIPLGYLNVVGYKIFAAQGMMPTLSYLFGVIFIEFFVVWLTLVFADSLSRNQRLTKAIEGFSVLFMFLLAYVFYAGSAKPQTSDGISGIGVWGTLATGLVLNAINFIQVPFWTGWNLYLLKGNYINSSGNRKFWFITGTVAGTFCGMLALIFSLDLLTGKAQFLDQYLMKAIIPLVFMGLGIFQAIQFYRKYYRKLF